MQIADILMMRFKGLPCLTFSEWRDLCCHVCTPYSKSETRSSRVGCLIQGSWVPSHSTLSNSPSQSLGFWAPQPPSAGGYFVSSLSGFLRQGRASGCRRSPRGESRPRKHWCCRPCGNPWAAPSVFLHCLRRERHRRVRGRRSAAPPRPLHDAAISFFLASPSCARRRNPHKFRSCKEGELTPSARWYQRRSWWYRGRFPAPETASCRACSCPEPAWRHH